MLALQDDRSRAPSLPQCFRSVCVGSDHGIGVGSMHFDPSTMEVTYSTSAVDVSSVSGLDAALSAKQDALTSLADVPGLDATLSSK